MDQLQQTGTAEEYILKFQALMLSTRYNNDKLMHQFLMGLKPSFMEKCTTASPVPKKVGQLMTITIDFQKAQDMIHIVRNSREPTGRNFTERRTPSSYPASRGRFQRPFPSQPSR